MGGFPKHTSCGYISKYLILLMYTEDKQQQRPITWVSGSSRQAAMYIYMDYIIPLFSIYRLVNLHAHHEIWSRAKRGTISNGECEVYQHT